MLNFYSLYDIKTKHYHVPFYAHSTPEALSMIRDQVSSGQCPALVDQLPDLVLFEIGTFDMNAGEFTPMCVRLDFDLSSFRKED